MEQVEKNARLVAARILERDGYASAIGSRVFEDLCEMARSLLTSPQRPWSVCEPERDPS